MMRDPDKEISRQELIEIVNLEPGQTSKAVEWLRRWQIIKVRHERTHVSRKAFYRLNPYKLPIVRRLLEKDGVKTG